MIVPSAARLTQVASLMGLDYSAMTNTEKVELIKFVQADALTQAQINAANSALAYYTAATAMVQTQEKNQWAGAWYWVQSVKRWAGITPPIPDHLKDFA